MLPRIQRQLKDDEQQQTGPFHQKFLGGEPEISHSTHIPNMTMNIVGRDSARIIGAVNNNFHGPVNQYYTNQDPINTVMLEWLWPRNPDTRNTSTARFAKQSKIHDSAVEIRKDQPVPWLIERSMFRQWYMGVGGSMWLWGKIGCGKTVMFSAVVSYIESSRVLDNRIRLGHYYCRFQDEDDNELTLILRRWIAQICYKVTPPGSLNNLHRLCHDVYPPRNPTSEELEAVLLGILRSQDSEEKSSENIRDIESQEKIFLLIDALDELTEAHGRNEEVFRFLNRLARANLRNVFILVTSRDRPDIRLYLQPNFCRLEVDYDAVNKDISLYVLETLRATPRLNSLSKEVKEAIRKRLADQANGMFLWATLQLNQLQSSRISNEAYYYRSLESLPQDLHETYNRVLSNIDHTLISKAILALKWIAFAKRPLFIEELVEVCAFEVGSSVSLESELERFSPYNMFELLQDLIIIQPRINFESPDTRLDRRTHTVTLIHISLVEYLIGQSSDVRKSLIFGFTVEEGHSCIARHCLSYLFHFNTIRMEQNDNRMLLEYAWYNWEKHISNTSAIDNPSRIRQKAVILFELLKNHTKSLQKQAGGSHVPSSPELRVFARILDWLPIEKLQTLVHVLSRPYFHPELNDFLRDNVTYSEVYTPLKETDIRLVYPLPCLDREEPVMCRIKSFNLEEKPDYDALSYVWGDWMQHSLAKISGIGVMITQNLSEILKTIRAQEIGQISWLWIDALCIDQSNIRERSHQVMKLTQIFNGAKEVIVCLGGESQDYEDAVKLLRHIGSTNLPPGGQYDHELLAPERSGVEELFEHPFWKRRWTVQEFVLARSGTMLAGSHSIPIGLVERAFERIVNEPNAVSPMWQLFAKSPILDAIRSYILTRQHFWSSGFFDLPELLCRFRNQKGISPHDKVFSVLGLLPPDHPFFIHLGVDYSKDFLELLLDTAILNLEHDGALNILSHVDQSDHKRLGPTWLPTYNHKTIPLISCDANSNVFNAGGKHKPRIETIRRKDSVLLRVLGCTVEDIASYKSSSFKPRGRLQWDTFLAGQSFYGHRLSNGVRSEIRAPPTTEEEELALLQSDEFKLWPDFRIDRHFFFTSSGKVGLGPRRLHIGDIVVIFAGGSVPYVLRRLPTPKKFRSKSGKYPFTKDVFLRKSETDVSGSKCYKSCNTNSCCYTFVGECYMSGIMDGEFVEDRQDKKEIWQTLCIH
ncbi:hypothetical protein BS50DRAFT_578933 [Corynespora cassiicola Philippines]|uniref:Uncharacterized protein n=1 Tax=Corynespora cassiicola Philippines TaxID=1448308 RepID=A0A2T2N5M9_CORCC|nr:hypothetical protein BS50DRAFT_578933 [Corynespora cassiicola Philippines]